MIGYLFLAIALFAGVSKGYCGKMISGKIVTVKDTVLANTVRMLACIAIGFFFVVIESGFPALRVERSTVFTAIVSGVCSSLFVISWLFAVKQSAYMMVETFLLAGTMIPITLSAIFFNEKIRVIQGIGLAILFIAVYIMSTYNTSVKGKMSFKSLIPLFAAGIANGAADFSQKAFARSNTSDTAAAFNFYTYIFAAATLVIFYVILSLKNKGESAAAPEGSKISLLGSIWVYILIMAICLFANSYFKTLAGKHINSAELYPLNQAASVILSLLMSRICFKEKINAKCIIGICLAFVAMLLINVL
jgi:drug/metabolite transporter (DMT)-like permease